MVGRDPRRSDLGKQDIREFPTEVNFIMGGLVLSLGAPQPKAGPVAQASSPVPHTPSGHGKRRPLCFEILVVEFNGASPPPTKKQKGKANHPWPWGPLLWSSFKGFPPPQQKKGRRKPATCLGNVPDRIRIPFDRLEDLDKLIELQRVATFGLG